MATWLTSLTLRQELLAQNYCKLETTTDSEMIAFAIAQEVASG